MSISLVVCLSLLTSVLLTVIPGAPVREAAASNPPIYIAFHWHMHQPIYVPYENVCDSMANDGEIRDWFDQRAGPYTTWPADAIEAGMNAGLGHLGASVSISGSLIENLENIEAGGECYGHFNNWNARYTQAGQWTTSLGNPRLDFVNFGYHHPLMPLTDDEANRRQIQQHQDALGSAFANPPRSKGIFPPENAFSESMIPMLKEEGIEWALIDNAHFERACDNYPWNSGGNLVEPNPIDQLNPDPDDWVQLNNVWAPTKVSAQWAHQPHWVEHTVENGTTYRMIAVPASRYLGNEDGRGGFGALQYESVLSQLEPYNTDPDHPILVVLAHDGDNYGGGNEGYYHGNFDNFVQWCLDNPDRFVPTTIQDYLDMFPPAADDVIHVEDGSWSGADNGDPEFKKWNGDPDDTGYSPDVNSWAVVTAARNYVQTAEQIDPGAAETAEAWRDLLNAETSCYWYWDGQDDWDAKATIASNSAAAHAASVTSGGPDNTPPTIYPPQREPYNPGGEEWGTLQSSDFEVWTLAFDLSGLNSVDLVYSVDGGAWQTSSMTPSVINSQTTVQPDYIADYYSSTLAGIPENSSVEYYVEAEDTGGNVASTEKMKVFVGKDNPGPDPPEPPPQPPEPPPEPISDPGEEPITIDGSFTDWRTEDCFVLGDMWDYYEFSDGMDTSRDLVAAYYREGEELVFFRADLSDLAFQAEEGSLDVYFILDLAAGGQEWLPDFSDCQTDMPWELALCIYQGDIHQVYDQDWNSLDAGAFDHAKAGVSFHSQWDSVEIGITKQVLLDNGWTEGANFSVQVYTTRDGTQGGLGEIPDKPDLTDSLPHHDAWNTGSMSGSAWTGDTVGTAKMVLFHHGNQFLKNVVDFVKDSNGMGFWRVPEIHDKWNVPVSLHVSGTLAEGIEWTYPAFNDYLEELHDRGLVEMVGGYYSEYIPKYLPPEVNNWSMEYARDYNELYYNDSDVPVAWMPERVFWDGYEDHVEYNGYGLVMVDVEVGYVRHAEAAWGQWDEGTRTGGEHKLYEEDNGLKVAFIHNRGKSGGYNNIQDQLHNPTDNGLYIGIRERALDLALSSDRQQYYLYMDDWEKTTGNIPDWGGPEVTYNYDKSIGWLAQHQWIEVVPLEDIMGLTPAGEVDIDDSCYFWMTDNKMGSYENYDAWYYDPNNDMENPSYFDYVPMDCADNLGDWQTPGTILGDVWAQVGTIPESSPLYELMMKTLSMGYYETAWFSYGSAMPSWQKEQSAHIRTAGIYYHAQQWLDDPVKAPSAQALDVDFDGDDEYVLSNEYLFTAFEARGGKCFFALNRSGVQFVGNQPTGWLAEQDAYTDAITISTSNVHYDAVPEHYQEGSKTYAFEDLYHENELYTGSADDGAKSLTFSTTGISKTFTLDGESILADYSETLGGNIGIRITANPDLAGLLRDGQTNLVQVGSSTGEFYGWRNTASVSDCKVLLDNVTYVREGSNVISKYVEVEADGDFVVTYVLGQGEIVNSPPTCTLSAPANATAVTSTSTYLTWTGHDIDGDAITYDIYIDTVDGNALLDTTTSTSYLVTGLVNDTVYHWTVIPSDAEATGSCLSGVWTFSVDTWSAPPNQLPNATLSSPSNGGIVTTTDVTLQWSGYDADGDALMYDVYLNSSGSTTQVTTTGTSYTATGLGNGTHYWTVVPSDPTGPGACLSGTWSFNVQLGTGGNQIPSSTLASPANGSAFQDGSVTFQWSGSDPDGDSLTYDLYMGKGQAPPLLLAGTTSTSFSTSGLTPGTYYWTVLPHDGTDEGMCSSGVWTFTVEASNNPPLVSITIPITGGIVTGEQEVRGSFSDPDWDAVQVQVRVDGGDWLNATMTFGIWTWNWSSYELENGPHWLEARAHDGADYSAIVNISVTIVNVDTDGDGTPDIIDEDDDNDGLADADELTLGTSPLVADTDGDGLLDGADPEPLLASSGTGDRKKSEGLWQVGAYVAVVVGIVAAAVVAETLIERARARKRGGKKDE